MQHKVSMAKVLEQPTNGNLVVSISLNLLKEIQVDVLFTTKTTIKQVVVGFLTVVSLGKSQMGESRVLQHRFVVEVVFVVEAHLPKIM
jgi:hypothetical protein